MLAARRRCRVGRPRAWSASPISISKSRTSRTSAFQSAPGKRRVRARRCVPNGGVTMIKRVPVKKGLARPTMHLIALWFAGHVMANANAAPPATEPATAIPPATADQRPNLIALSRCRVLAVEGTVIEIDGIDALADTPVLDIKP
ncbi:MAG: TrmO family methyltransferase [Thiohalocapsa sp.]